MCNVAVCFCSSDTAWASGALLDAGELSSDSLSLYSVLLQLCIPASVSVGEVTKLASLRGGTDRASSVSGIWLMGVSS